MGVNLVRAAAGRGLLWLAAGGALTPAAAQSPLAGTLAGRVTEAERALPLAGVQVVIAGQRVAITGADGRYSLSGLPAGQHQVTFRWIGYAPRRMTTALTTGTARVLDVALERNPVMLGEVSVNGVSRTPERIVEAPAAVAVAEPAHIREMGATGQVPLLVGDLTGVHVAQSGLYDFNLNTRGFNGALNRRTLVLVDGRDVAIPILGNQDWADMSLLEEGTAVEMVRGPGSALYGANAFSGVLAIRTPTVRESRGARLSVTTGELATRRADARYGYLAANYRWGVRVSGGFQQSQTWDRSRTSLGDAAREYAAAGFAPGVVHPPPPGYEARPLAGQMTYPNPGGTPGTAAGSPDPVQTWYGSARADWYSAGGSVLTAEGGLSRVENTVIATPGGRSQVTRADRPWARVAWNADAFSVFGYYTGRDGEQFNLATGTRAVDEAGTLHLEGQFNRSFSGTRGRLVAGASARRQTVDSRGTILGLADDGRADRFFALFQQVDYEITPTVKLIGASRLDEGTLYDPVFSPKLGVMVTPRKNQSVRLTWNRGFLTPSSFQRFLYFPAAPPIDLRALEGGLRASPLGPALSGVPNGALFDVSSAVPVLALGNRTLKPEDVTGMELGYKGQLGRVFLTVDAYYSDIKDFSTGVLAGVNPEYQPWTAPTAVPEAARAALETAVRGTMGTGFTRLSSGTSAYVLSMGNAGRATEYGVEVGISVQVNARLRVDANGSGYRVDLEQRAFHPADTVEANTPPHSANVAAVYEATNGARARVGVRWEDGFTFRSGTWVGDLPSARSVDVNFTYPLGHRLTVTLTGTNVLDEQRVHLMGGSLIGRRVLVTLGWSQ